MPALGIGALGCCIDVGAWQHRHKIGLGELYCICLALADRVSATSLLSNLLGARKELLQGYFFNNSCESSFVVDLHVLGDILVIPRSHT